MNRQGVAIQTNSEIEVPESEAIALCRNSLAAPIGWELPALEGAEEPDLAEPDDGSLVDGEGNAPKVKGKKARA